MTSKTSHFFPLGNVRMRTQELVITVIVLGSALTWISMSELELAHSECNLTRYPNLCAETLTGLGSGNHNVDNIVALVNKTIYETNLSSSYFAEFKINDVQEAHSVVDYCEELMGMSLKRLDQSMKALKSPTRNKNDIQTWLSASLTFKQSCKDYVDAHSSKLGIMESMSKKMEYLSQLGSNSLSLANRITNMPKSTKASHKLGANEKEHEFPTWVSAKGRKLLQGATIKANAIVAQDGSGNYKTISEAIEAASGTRFVIYVKKGVYKEKIRTKKDGITLIGDGKYSTIIVGDDSVAKGATLPDSATFTITGDGFVARDMGFHNSAGPEGQQAVALNIASDRSVLYRCSIAGSQDTLYAHALRQFYTECDIHGTIDFIFGNAAAVFQRCSLILRRPHSGGYNAVLANGRTDPEQNTGFSVHKCSITPGSDLSPVKRSFSSFLGRPWKEYSRAIDMGCSIDDAIAARGWIEWPGSGSSALRTFAEYGNEGPGAGTSKRVLWPGFRLLGADEAVKFTVASFIAGNSWIPSSGALSFRGSLECA
ncbi:pectinesterase [Abrus precatorius]|uniref:Pectinesterase n=1 Tax=Abrus precatorius TaxID=3816 RepID=A0A8B8K5K1_ABRPR|nr:pectinesterase [Abrus precatorius]